MTDLTDEELDEYGAATDNEYVDDLVTVRMAAEIRRHRAARAADSERVRAVVKAACMAVERTAVTAVAIHKLDAIIDGAADALTSPLPALTAERVRSVVREAAHHGLQESSHWEFSSETPSTIRLADVIAARAAEQLAGAPVPVLTDDELAIAERAVVRLGDWGTPEEAAVLRKLLTAHRKP